MAADVKALIHHYARLGHYRHIQTVCDEVIKKRGKDPTLVFWKAFGCAMEGSYPEAIRTLDAVASHRDVEFPAICALLHYHKNSRTTDSEAVSNLSGAQSTAQSRATPAARILASSFYLHTGQFGRAKMQVDKVLEDNPQDVQALTMAGWIDLSLPRNSKGNMEKSENAIQSFEAALRLTDSRKELEALLGKTRHLVIKKDYDAALECLNQAIVIYPWFLPAVVEKAKVHLSQNEWDSATEMCDKVLEQDPADIESLRLITLMALTRDCNPTAAAANLAKLVNALDHYEPRNAQLYVRISQPFARLAQGSSQVLTQTAQLVSRARKLRPDSSEFATEYGYQQELRKEYGSATESYREASKLEETNVQALTGMIRCQIVQGKLEDAEQQLELFRMVQSTIGRSSELLFLDALLAWRKDENREKHVKALDETVGLHLKVLRTENQVQGVLDIYDYFYHFNPQYLLDIVKEYMTHVSAEPDGGVSTPSVPLGRSVALLEKLTAKVPGFLEAQYLLASVKFAGGKPDDALRTVERCFRLDSSFAPAYLLAAKIHLSRDSPTQASHMLDQAMSHNFKVRDHPVYHIIKASVLESQGAHEKAVESLNTALELPGMKGDGGRGRRGGGGGGGGGGRGDFGSAFEVSIQDKATLYVKLVSAYTNMDKLKEAVRIASEAHKMFTGTTEEVRIIIAKSEIAIKSGRMEKAISMLGSIPFSSPSYRKAQMTKADIYLKHRRNKIKYLNCYREMVERDESDASYILLGDAYMRIQMADEAIQAYEEALRLRQDNPVLQSKLGEAFVAAHDYRAAVDYYEKALLRDPSNSQIQSELIELYIKLGQFNDAGKLLDQALVQANESDDVSTLLSARDNFLLLARVHQGRNNNEEAIEALGQALKVQNKALAKLRAVQPDMLIEQREEAAKICHKLALAHDNLRPRQEDKAIAFCLEALKAHESFEPAMLTLAKLHLRRGELDACQSQCTTLSRVNPESEEASIMLADLMFRKNETEAAMFHFQSLLEKQPRHYDALQRLISLLKRAGRLSDAPKFLRMAERSSPKAVHENGFKFCKGLYARYNNEPHEAIKFFNEVRYTGDWGIKAVEHMIEIYTNPDNQDLWVDDESVEALESRSEKEEPQRVAERLLIDIPESARSARHVVLEAYIAIASKKRAHIESVLEKLTEIMKADMNYVPAVVAYATGLLLTKQAPKAKNQLKRVSRMNYDAEYHEDLMKGWLMLADIFIKSGKLDQAQSLCSRVLKFDRSYARAWEYMGFIMEKELSYTDAADSYEKAWEYSNQASAVVGYKLAFNYLKAKRYVEAITVCHQVLELFPEYPRIKKDILEKARAALRP